MKRFKTIVSMLLISILLTNSPILAASNNGKGNKNNPNEQVEIQEKKDAKEKKKEEKKKEKEEIKEAKKILDKEMKEQRKKLKEEEKSLKEIQKELEKQWKEAEKVKDTKLAEKLKKEIEKLETKKLDLKAGIKDIHNEIKEVIKRNYTIDELEELEKLGKEIIEKYNDLANFPIENIIIDNNDIKFDTPPVIKEGRILIPVRAITRGMKADLEWNQEEKMVTIIKDDVEIILYIDEAIALINGKEVELDIVPSLYNNSTYVPLRFIAENLGLKVDYDEDEDLVIIQDEDEKNADKDEEVDEINEKDENKN